MRKKTLAFMYIGESHGFHKQKFNFSTKELFDVRTEDDGKIILRKEEICKKKLSAEFWGKDILEVNLLVGKNGAGKTTVMRFICQWICQLSQKQFPMETGILVFKDNDDLAYIAFSEREEIPISTNIRKMELHGNGYFSDFFEDVQLLYCSNTMTELKIAGYDIFQDCSLPRRLREANAHGHGMGEDITRNFEHYEFDRQINVALEDEEFPIDYILMEIHTYSFNELDGLLSHHKKDMQGEFQELMESMSDNGASGSQEDLLKNRLLYAVFMGLIIKMLKWGKKYRDNDRNQVEDSLEKIFVDYIIKIIQNRGKSLKDFLKDFYKELFDECHNSYQNSIQREDYGSYWGDIGGYVNQAMDFIGNKGDNQFFKGWAEQTATDKTEGETHAWIINFKENKKGFTSFWKVYYPIASRLENIHFSWVASSGQKSWAELFSELKRNKDSIHQLPECSKNIWYLLDEPDNTFHPDWKRILINEIVMALSDGCGKKQVWISTHSPIMLSDMPGQAVTCLKTTSEGNKEVDDRRKDTFGQNIYVLYNDAFFLQHGVIGAFASAKINKAVEGLENIEKKLMDMCGQGEQSKESLEEIANKIVEYEETADLLAEPLFGTQIKRYLKNCHRLLERVKQSDKNKH